MEMRAGKNRGLKAAGFVLNKKGFFIIAEEHGG
jgi:hypothetical protein